MIRSTRQDPGAWPNSFRKARFLNLSIAPQSAALRAIGPIWSSVAASSNTP